jgi:hypothetical protein
MLRKPSRLFVIVATIGLAGALGIACSSAPSTETTCDPALDPNCENGGEDTGGATDTSAQDSTVAPGDTSWTPPDGYTPCLDGGYVCGPDGEVIPIPDGSSVGCTPGPTECTNCIDDDNDGLIDWLDPECTGPLDNDEGSFATGIPGDNIDACKQDCWFDGNSGAGDDGCDWNGKCLVGSTEPRCTYDPVAAADPKQCPPPSQKCIDFCKPLTPKGCDCAGCCQVFDSSGTAHTVKLVAGCTSETLSDPAKCPPCGQIADCTNPCGRCDYCLGKTELPADCTPTTPPPDAGDDTGPPPETGCPNNYQACSPSVACPEKFYCLTGCCIPSVQ